MFLSTHIYMTLAFLLCLCFTVTELKTFYFEFYFPEECGVNLQICFLEMHLPSKYIMDFELANNTLYFEGIIHF